MTIMELQFKDKIISAPLLDNRVVSIVITQQGDNIEINFGGMDIAHPEMTLIWFNGRLELDDELLVSFKSMDDDTCVSLPISKYFHVPEVTDEDKIRIYHSLKKKLENTVL